METTKKLTKKQIEQLTVLLIYKQRGNNTIQLCPGAIMVNNIVVANGWQSFKKFVAKHLLDETFFTNPNCLIPQVWSK